MEGELGRDDIGTFRVLVPDQLRPGQEEDAFGQEYNYEVDQDNGDRTDVDWEAEYWAAQERYWLPGEDHLMHEYKDPEADVAYEMDEERERREWEESGDRRVRKER